MFHLTPQEKSVLTALLVICLAGSALHFALTQDLPLVRWVKDANRSYTPRPPDINTADSKALERLPGVGPKTAQNIVTYRQAHGAFAHLEDLRKVKGITKKNFVRISALYEKPHSPPLEGGARGGGSDSDAKHHP